MPYIKEEHRARAALFPESAGELNYAITERVNRYLKTQQLSYQTINDVLGALEGAKSEFYRRIAVPYENAKLSENGDVY
jgi:hypothetical protein